MWRQVCLYPKIADVYGSFKNGSALELDGRLHAQSSYLNIDSCGSARNTLHSSVGR